MLARLEERQVLLELISKLINKQVLLDNSIASLDRRVATIQSELSSVTSIKKAVADWSRIVNDQAAATSSLVSRLDDAKDRSRRCNLIFYGLPDTTGETWLESERKIVSRVNEHLGITLDDSHIERARRIGTFNAKKSGRLLSCFLNLKRKTKSF